MESEATAITLDDLTPRQREIVLLLAEGLTDRAIAKRLGVAVPTVYNQLTRIAQAVQLKTDKRYFRRAKLIAMFFDLVPKRRRVRARDRAA